MSEAPAQPAARLSDPVAHSQALGGFLAGALVGLAAAAGVAIVAGMAATAIAAEVATAGLATPLVAGVAVTVGEFAVNAAVGGALTGMAERAGEALGSKSMGPASGAVSQGSPNVLVNGLPAARVGDAESCHGGQVAQGSTGVFINGRPAARVGDKTTCGAVIVGGSGNVFIGGGTTTRLPIQSEVPQWVRWAAVVVGLLPALGGAARVFGRAIAEVAETGLARAAQTGVKALGRAMEERAGGARPVAAPTSAAADDDVAATAAKLHSAKTPEEIEDARESLKKLDYDSRNQVLNNFASHMDVSTAPNTATFYSGGRVVPTGVMGQTEFVSARSYAESAVANSNLTTLEQTPGGGVLDKVDVFRSSDPLLNDEDATNLWSTASQRYAQGANGDVTAYVGNPRSTSIYNTVERPSLDEGINSGRVTSIQEYDMNDIHDRLTR